MRAKIPLLAEAFIGHFTDHHALMRATILSRIDETGDDMTAVRDAHRWGDHPVLDGRGTPR